MCAASDEGKSRAYEVSYFKAVKASLAKLSEKEPMGLSKREVEARLHQLLERSIISEDVIDVFEAMSIKRSEINILSEEFLQEVRDMTQQNLAVEMLKKQLESNIKAMEKRNLVKSEKFSEKFQKALKIVMRQAEKMCGTVYEEAICYDKVA